ncbi:MAG: hypothetical protein KJT01_05590 [Gemmatimonadetes bacterium]|nr:hypothetical protein [Gemmatimonadota bacterium]
MLTANASAPPADSHLKETPWGRSAIPIRRAADFTGLRLGRALQGYLAFLIAVSMLAPFRFVADAPPIPPMAGDQVALVLGFLMFLPLGYVYQFTRPRGAPVDWGRLLVLGAGLSVAVGAARLWIPGRTPAILEAAANVAGTLLGGWGYHRIFRMVRASQAVKQLALELPLVAVLYLLVPVVALLGLGVSPDQPHRAWLVLPLVAIAGCIVGGVRSGYRNSAARTPSGAVPLSALAWLGVALLPAMVRQPLVLAGALPLFLAADRWWHGVIQRRIDGPGADQRFELPTLRVVLPVFVAYLLASALWPFTGWQAAWSVAVPLFPGGVDALSAPLFHTVERVAAFTVLGYLVAEVIGRRAQTFGEVAPWVLGVAMAMAAATEGVRGFLPGQVASGLMPVLLTVSALFGARVYQLQRDHVRALIRRSGA